MGYVPPPPQPAIPPMPKPRKEAQRFSLAPLWEQVCLWVAIEMQIASEAWLPDNDRLY